MMSESDVRQILVGERTDVLLSIFEAANQSWINFNQPSWSPKGRANYISEELLREGKKQLEVLDGVEHKGFWSGNYFLFDGVLGIRLKMLQRETLLTANTQTKAIKRLWTQGTLDIFPNLYFINCGYVLNSTEASMEKIMLTREIRRSIEWAFDLRELVAGDTSASTPIIPNLDVVPTTLPKIVQKTRKAKTSE